MKKSLYLNNVMNIANRIVDDIRFFECGYEYITIVEMLVENAEEYEALADKYEAISDMLIALTDKADELDDDRMFNLFSEAQIKAYNRSTNYADACDNIVDTLKSISEIVTNLVNVKHYC